MYFPVHHDDDGQANGNLGGRHRDDKEYQNLGVKDLMAGDQTITGEGNECQVGRIKHDLKAHEDDDDAAAQHHPAESHGEEDPAG